MAVVVFDYCHSCKGSKLCLFVENEGISLLEYMLSFKPIKLILYIIGENTKKQRWLLKMQKNGLLLVLLQVLLVVFIYSYCSCSWKIGSEALGEVFLVHYE